MPPATLTASVLGAKAGTSVEVVPGQRITDLSPEAVPVIALADMVPAGDGTFRPVARICPRYFKVTLANLKLLKIAVSDRTIIRLIIAGFVSGGPISPGHWQFDYLDYLRHVEEVKANPEEFWSIVEPGQVITNMERYRSALRH